MANKRKVEVFSAGCGVCDDTVSLLKRIACDSCEVSVLDIRDGQVAERAKSLRIRAVPAVVVDGVLVACCKDSGPTESALRASGIGQALG
jgi:hypothetical protein